MGRIETKSKKLERLAIKLANRLKSLHQNPSDIQDIETKTLRYNDMLSSVLEYEKMMLNVSSKYRLAMMISSLIKYSEEACLKNIEFNFL